MSRQSLLKENCQNSRNSDDIDMKLGPATKMDKRNKTTSKKSDNDVKSTNCDVIVIWSNPDSGRTVCKTYIFINSRSGLYEQTK